MRRLLELVTLTGSLSTRSGCLDMDKPPLFYMSLLILLILFSGRAGVSFACILARCVVRMCRRCQCLHDIWLPGIAILVLGFNTGCW